MRIRNVVVGSLAVLIGLPLLVGLIAAVTINVLDRTSGTLVSSGVEREYLLHVPASYDGTEPTPLVVSLHAGATWPAHQMNLSGWNAVADEQGFIVVYPSGSRMPKMWHTFHAGPGLERDVRFISELIDTLQALYNIDPGRIYANGMSNGGGMAFVLSCALADRIAAVGLVASAQSLPSGWCADASPVPVMAFHGDADPIVPYGGGPLGDPFNPVKPVFEPVQDWVGRWAERNACAPRPVEADIAPDARRLQYTDCAEGASVTLYTLSGSGHSWPGGKPPPEWRVGPTTQSVDATRLMWEFYRERSSAADRADEAVPAARAPSEAMEVGRDRRE